jgi:septal ring factor EnvC (AmiA/AmiB activator)
VANLNDWLIPLLTFLGTVFAGAGLKWIEGFLKKAKDKDDTATNLRNELRAELTALKAEIAATEKELDQWRARAYQMQEQLLYVRIQLEAAKRLLESNNLVLPEVPPMTATPSPLTLETKDGTVV